MFNYKKMCKWYHLNGKINFLKFNEFIYKIIFLSKNIVYLLSKFKIGFKILNNSIEYTL